MTTPCHVDIDVAIDRSFKCWEKVSKGLPEEELCDLSQSKIKAFKDALDEVNNKFHLGGIIQTVPIWSDDEGNFILIGNLLTETSIVENANAKKKQNMSGITRVETMRLITIKHAL